jgi:DNA-binding response OmpR family regulator
MKKCSILLVDDDDDILFHYKNILSNNDFNVDCVPYGEQAVAKIKEKKYDLAILDIMLPDIRGDKLALELREIDPNILLIFITGFSYMDYCITALDIGISEILMKPITATELIDSIYKNLLGLSACAH